MSHISSAVSNTVKGAIAGAELAGQTATEAATAAGKVAATAAANTAANTGQVVPPNASSVNEAFRSLGQATSTRTAAQWNSVVTQAFQQIGTSFGSPHNGSFTPLPPFPDGSVRNPITDGSSNTVTFPERGGLTSNSLEGLNSQINNLQAKLQNGSISDSEMLQLQSLLQRQLQLISAISNILKMQHDAQMAIINNIR